MNNLTKLALYQNLPKSIITFKQTNKELWNDCVNHKLTNLLTSEYEEFDHNKWFNFIKQEQYCNNVLRYNVEKSKLVITNDNIHQINYKRPKHTEWNRLQINKKEANASSLNHTSTHYCLSLINKCPRYFNLGMLIRLIIRIELCSDNVNKFENVLNYELYSHTDSFDRSLESRLHFISSYAGKTSYLIRRLGLPPLNELASQESGDIEEIYESVTREIEFFDQIN